MIRVKGHFIVKMSPLEFSATGKNGMNLGRMALEKYFNGPVEGESRGEMISVITPVKGSAGYVAIEQMQGQVEGRKGSFVLQHCGFMNKGEQRLTLEVVPDSGTDELEGIKGSMRILIENGKHFYEFDYEL